MLSESDRKHVFTFQVYYPQQPLTAAFCNCDLIAIGDLNTFTKLLCKLKQHNNECYNCKKPENASSNFFIALKFKEMSLTLEQYKDILTIALDHQLAQLPGGIVFDNFDPAVEGDKVLRTRMESLVKQKKIDKLQRMLHEIIQRFQFKDQFDFASVLLQKTGYRIEPIPQ